jgi:hypothetical protein
MLNTSAQYRVKIYDQIRKFRGRVTIDVPGQPIATYDDDTIISMKILDEMSVLNDYLPSNELQLTLDNSTGAFNYLTIDNMQTIIASKPTIETELGLLLFELINQETLTNNLSGKVYGSLVENPNRYLYKYASALPAPTDFTTEATQTHINNVFTSDGTTSALTTATNGNTPYGLWRFDIIEILERRYGEGIWAGATSRADKAILCEDYVGYMTAYWRGYGTTPTGNTATLRLGSGSSYFGTTRSHTSGANTTISISTSSIASAITWDGYVNIAAYSGASDGVTASYLRTDNVWLDIRVDPFEAIEWRPTGKFFLTSWNNEITNKIITMVGNDYFALFSDISYEPIGITNLGDLARDVLTKGGVPTANQIIDPSLDIVTVNPLQDRTDIRTVLQYIGIAARSAVSQDREGNVFIKPFKTLDEATNYITYTQTQNGLYTYAGPSMYPLNDTGGGMRYLDFDNVYEAPKVSLEKSIYQLIVRVYPVGDIYDVVYTNTFIAGTNGDSFLIDNPLINTTELADQVAEWYLRETNYNALYSVRWRQNPALECADMILIEDSFNAEKQSRITRTEFTYQGYLEGVIESRGGV